MRIDLYNLITFKKLNSKFLKHKYVQKKHVPLIVK